MSRRNTTRAKPGATADSATEPSTPSPAPESPTIDPRVAELEGLRAQDAELIAKLRADLDAAVADRDNANVTIERLRAERVELEQRFQREWERREKETEAMLIRSGRPAAVAELPEIAPVKGKIVRATCRLRAHSRAGEPVTIEALQPIPADVDVAKLDKGTWEEV
jgi:hypothetical protein